MKRILSLILTAVMILSVFAGLQISSSALAASGKCGDNVTWSFDSSTGKLTIAGKGPMENYYYDDENELYFEDYCGFRSPFYSEKEIKEVVIEKGVTSIGDEAFYYCSNLTNITIPDSVTVIGHYAFYYCSILTTINIPNSVTSIGDEAFYGCGNLTGVIIPNSVTRMGWFAFGDCERAIRLNYMGTKEQWCNYQNEGSELAGPAFEDNVQVHLNYNPSLKHTYSAVNVAAPKSNALGYAHYKCYCGEYLRTVKGENYRKYIAPTGKVTGVKCVARTAKAQKFTWKEIKGVGGYQVRLLDASGKEVRLKVALKNAYIYTDLKVPGYAYKVQVRTFIKAPDENYYFGPWSAVLNSPTLPAGTSIIKLTRARRAFTAQWKKGAVTGYQIQYARNSKLSGAKTVTIKNAKTLKYTAKKLAAYKYYYVRIRTYKKINNKNYFSAWSKNYKVKTK